MQGNAHKLSEHPAQSPALPHAPLAQRLAALIDGATVHAPSGPEHAPSESVAQARAALDWTTPERAAFCKHLLDDPVITDAQHPGVTRSRVRTLLPEHRKVQVDAILRWLDAAQVLSPPLALDAPFRHPRRLTCADPAALADRLAATPFPQPGAAT